MGMFDSFIDRVGREWQTKELDCRLLVWRLGDTINSEHIPKRGTVKIRVYDYDETKKELVDATVKVVNGIVKSIRPDKAKLCDGERTMSKTPADVNYAEEEQS